MDDNRNKIFKIICDWSNDFNMYELFPSHFKSENDFINIQINSLINSDDKFINSLLVVYDNIYRYEYEIQKCYSREDYKIEECLYKTSDFFFIKPNTICFYRSFDSEYLDI